MSNTPIGHLHPEAYGHYRAVCSTPGCSWSYTAGRKKAEDTLLAHARGSHPEPIPVFRKGNA